MAQQGEIEVFRITPVEGNCYEHIEATRSQYIGGGNHRYFSRNAPRYVGKYIKTLRYGYGDGGSVIAVFQDGLTENRVDYSYEGNTCFIEVRCRIESTIKSKALNQTVRNIYERKTGRNSSPGEGPANSIRQFLGVKVPKGAEGGMRSKRSKRSMRKTRKNKKRSKKSRRRF